MGWFDLLILAAVFVPAAFAVGHLWKRRGRGCGGNCAGCSGCGAAGREERRHADAP